MTRFAWWRQDLHAIELLRAHIGEWTMTQMLDYWRVMCFTCYRLNWNPWIWIPFPIDSECTLLFSPSSWPEDHQGIFDGWKHSNLSSRTLAVTLFSNPSNVSPRDRFLPSELVVPLVDAHYRQDYHIWKQRLDANIRATHYLVDHLRDPSGTVAFSRAIEAPVGIPFVHTGCQSCRTQVVAWISHHISQLQWPHTT
jgi:hypothetical protein